MASTIKPYPPISSRIPPLLLGTAAFNHQFNPSPSSLPTHSIIQHALDSGLLGFDTSPYYGPAEAILGASLTDPDLRSKHPRGSYFLTTKVGRISAETFDYSPAWVRRSISRSIARLGAEWLDLVLCHDVEFVTTAEVLGAVAALRELRSGGGTRAAKVRYIGISGYPVDVLCDLAELVLRETGEPLDAVMSYANFTVQNSRLHTAAALRLKAAGVGTVLNASPLGMGLLRRDGVPVGSMGDWHPAPAGLREACVEAAQFCEQASGGAGGAGGEPLAKVALRYALEEWLRVGADAGLGTAAPFAKTQNELTLLKDGDGAMQGGEGGGGGAVDQLKGVSVCGVSYLEELTGTLNVFRSILLATADSGTEGNNVAAAKREKDRNRKLVEGIRGVLGPWVDYVWDSPGKDFVRKEPRHDERGDDNGN